MNKSGQMGGMLAAGMTLIFSIIMIYLGVAFISGMWGDLQGSWDEMRDQDVLNCESDFTCDSVNATDVCYNSSRESRNMECVITGISPSLILIMLVLGLVGLAGVGTYIGQRY